MEKFSNDNNNKEKEGDPKHKLYDKSYYNYNLRGVVIH